MKDTAKSAQSAQVYSLPYEGANLVTPSEDICTKCTKNKHHQFTALFIRTYMTEANLQRFIRDTTPEAFAYILHDQEGQPHYHLLAYYPHRVRISTLARYTDGQQTYLEAPRQYAGAYKYLTHTNHPKKYQYDPANIVSVNSSFFTLTAHEKKENEMDEFLQDLNTLPRREMAIKYGKDYIRNYKRYTDFNDLINYDEMRSDIDRLEEVKPSESSVLREYGISYDTIGRQTLTDFVNFLQDHYDPSNPLTLQTLTRLYYAFERYHEAVRKHYIMGAIRHSEASSDDPGLSNEVRRQLIIRCKWEA